MLHIIKLCVGCDSVEELAEWQRKRKPLAHWTRNRPKRDKEIIAGGSLYWVIKGQIRVRQRILGLERREDEEGVWCSIMLGRRLVRVQPMAHRAFQGWRYHSKPRMRQPIWRRARRPTSCRKSWHRSSGRWACCNSQVMPKILPSPAF